MPDSRLLILDDADADRRLLCEALCRTTLRAPVRDAADPDEALAWMRRVSPDGYRGSLLLDLNLGTRHGLEILAEVRSDPALATARVVVLTGADDDGLRERARVAGADGWAVKPADWGGWRGMAAAIAGGGFFREAEERLRETCGPLAGPVLFPSAGLIGSGQMSLAAALPASHSHLVAARAESAARADVGVGQLLRDILEVVVCAATQSVDPEGAEIRRVCLKHKVRESLARGRCMDHVVVAKRHGVLRELILSGWDDPTLMDWFDVGKRLLERLRAETRAELCGKLTRG